MSYSYGVRRKPRGSSPVPLAVAGALIALAIAAFVVVLVGPEIQHRADSSWHYEQVTLTKCTATSQSVNQGFGYFCTFATVPPLPFASDPYLDVNGSNHTPRSTERWVHVIDGRITGTDGGATLGFLALLIIPLLYVVGFAASVRKAHRAGRRWRDPRGR